MPAIRKTQRVPKVVKEEDTTATTNTTDTPDSKLKHQLLITPKTVSILHRIGITDYRDLQNFSTNQLVAQIALQPDVKASNAEGYRRAARRMVWLGTQDDPGTIAKNCPDWNNKSLKAKDAWVDGFDDLTGREMDERFGKILMDAVGKSDGVEVKRRSSRTTRQ